MHPNKTLTAAILARVEGMVGFIVWLLWFMSSSWCDALHSELNVAVAEADSSATAYSNSRTRPACRKCPAGVPASRERPASARPPRAKAKIPAAGSLKRPASTSSARCSDRQNTTEKLPSVPDEIWRTLSEPIGKEPWPLTCRPLCYLFCWVRRRRTLAKYRWPTC